MVIEACRRHLPAICGQAFADRRTELIVGDGIRYMAENRQAFDLIVVDSTDPVGPAAGLFGAAFFAMPRTG